jgi:hypothetical protein
MMMSEVTLPRRQRRRPALSCVECRRRKIKCDRKTPCSNCLQYKSTICTFPDSHPPNANRRTAPKAAPTSHSVHEHQRIPETTSLTSVVSGSPFPDTSPTPPSIPSLMSSSQSERVSYVSRSPPEKNDQNLDSRTTNLEKLALSSASSLNKHTDEVMSVLGADFSSLGDVMLMVGLPTHAFKVYPTKNTISNSESTQFFGRSHWMNTFNMVRQNV